MNATNALHDAHSKAHALSIISDPKTGGLKIREAVLGPRGSLYSTMIALLYLLAFVFTFKQKDGQIT